MKKSRFFILLAFQVIIGALLLTAMGVGRIYPEEMPAKGAVGMAVAGPPHPDAPEKKQAPKTGGPSTKKATSHDRNVTVTTHGPTASSHATPTTTVPRTVGDESFSCPTPVSPDAKRVNSSYSNGYREFFVLPTGAYIGPYAEWYDPYKEKKKALTCFGPNGAQDGPSLEWSEKGVLLSQKSYSSGLLEGAYRTYYHNGAPKEEYLYLKGKRSGAGRTYYEDGTLMSAATYIDGKKYGAENEYYPDGKLRQQRYYDGDEWTGVSISYDQNGERDVEWSGEMRAGKFSGLYAEWKRSVACIYKDGRITDCRHMKAESYKRGEIILESLKVMIGSERMNAIPHFFDEE